MLYFSTRNPSLKVSVQKAVELGLAMDGGLFMPEYINPLPLSFWQNLHTSTYPDIVWQVMHPFFGGGLPESSFQRIVDRICSIPIPVVPLADRLIVELFHGPTLAFKDIGATWMAGILGEYQQNQNRKLDILVATSGDTGGAVASAFHKIEGITVHILYPKGKVSPFQENQIAGLGSNIHALAVDGTFDDCQSMVKKAFQDKDLRLSLRLTSANSINVARWIPQCIPYIESYRQCTTYPQERTFTVPCGNLGNLSAGLFAQKLGLPSSSLVVSTNENDSFIQYIHHGFWKAKHTIATLANAMDVGDPSNIDRVKCLLSSTWNIPRPSIRGYKVTDEEIRSTIKTVYSRFGYTLDPHSATAWQAIDTDQKEGKNDHRPLLMATAHPSKFMEIISSTVDLPTEIETAFSSQQRKNHQFIGADFNAFKEYLQSSR